MDFKTSFETPEAEAERLPSAHPDSDNYDLGNMPVNIHVPVTAGLLIRITGDFGHGDYIVTPITAHPLQSQAALAVEARVEGETRKGYQRSLVTIPLAQRQAAIEATNLAEGKPRKRYQRSWDCIVVASNDPRIPVGGHRISLPEFKLVRGTLHQIVL